MKINPVRSSRVVTSSMFAKQLTKHSSSWQAKGYSASNGINELLLSGTRKLKQKKINSASLDAEVLLSFILKKSREFLFSHPEKIITKEQKQAYLRLIKRRQKLEPVAYLVKNKEFYGLNFYVDKRVLIPRPETEILVEEVIKEVRSRQKTTDHKPQATRPLRIAKRVGRASHEPTIADIGTGSGCLAITLAKHLPQAKIMATDICQKALAVAKKNAKKHNLLKKIKFFQGDLLNPIIKKFASTTEGRRIDVIIANLPYLTKAELKNVPFEPKKAVFGGKEGLEIMEKFLKQIKILKSYPKFIFFEISPPQTDKIKKLVKKYLPRKRIKFIKDLSERKRVVEIKCLELKKPPK